MTVPISFHGNMTAPVEVRYTPGGKAVGNVTVAVNRKRGEVEETDFYRVTLWESLAENAANLDKGTRVIVEGRQASREYETKDGQKRTAWEVTADAFGPDLRFVKVEVTRSGQSGAGQNAQTGGSTGQWSSAPIPGASSASDGWAPYGDDSPF